MRARARLVSPSFVAVILKAFVFRVEFASSREQLWWGPGGTAPRRERFVRTSGFMVRQEVGVKSEIAVVFFFEEKIRLVPRREGPPNFPCRKEKPGSTYDTDARVDRGVDGRMRLRKWFRKAVS